jgi:hypothetical protein
MEHRHVGSFLTLCLPHFSFLVERELHDSNVTVQSAYTNHSESNISMITSNHMQCKLSSYDYTTYCRCLLNITPEGSSQRGEEIGAIGRRALGTVVRDLPSFVISARGQGLLLLVLNYLGAFALLQ